MTAALEIKGLHAWYGESHVLHGVDMVVQPGEVVTLLGREGAAALGRFEGDRFDDAAEIFADVALGETFPTFLTVSAYSRYLVELD